MNSFCLSCYYMLPTICSLRRGNLTSVTRLWMFKELEYWHLFYKCVLQAKWGWNRQSISFCGCHSLSPFNLPSSPSPSLSTSSSLLFEPLTFFPPLFYTNLETFSWYIQRQKKLRVWVSPSNSSFPHTVQRPAGQVISIPFGVWPMKMKEYGFIIRWHWFVTSCGCEHKKGLNI